MAYPWHPWAGQVVRVHGVIARPSGSMARCSLIPDSTCRVRQFPRWMLDAASCQSMRQAERPMADLSALIALRTLLLEVMSSPRAIAANIGKGRPRAIDPTDRPADVSTWSAAGSPLDSGGLRIPLQGPRCSRTRRWIALSHRQAMRAPRFEGAIGSLTVSDGVLRRHSVDRRPPHTSSSASR